MSEREPNKATNRADQKKFGETHEKSPIPLKVSGRIGKWVGWETVRLLLVITNESSAKISLYGRISFLIDGSLPPEPTSPLHPP
jgi:hypothetical protein